MNKISAYIIAFNEEKKIADAIKSVEWADEIVLIDSHSKDRTAQIAEEMGARVVQVKFNGFGRLRTDAVNACSFDWIFSLDSDERCTADAAQEIQQIVKSDQADICYVPRRNFFLGKEIKHSGWYPNYRQPQLFKKGFMTYDESPVHEKYEIKEGSRIHHLNQAIWQLPFNDIAESIAKMNRYSSLGALKPRQKGSSYPKALGHGIWAFLRHYVFKRGFLDGWAGFIIAFSYFEVTFYRYAKAVELTHQDEWDVRWKEIQKTNPTKN
jgi:glycosyltransferase involved in cell wall biosynthesis